MALCLERGGMKDRGGNLLYATPCPEKEIRAWAERDAMTQQAGMVAVATQDANGKPPAPWWQNPLVLVGGLAAAILFLRR